MSEEEKEAIENLKILAEFMGDNYFFSKQGIKDLRKELKISLALISNLQKELDEEVKIINKTIEKIEILRQYFSEDLQPDFIMILEILKNKKVIDW